MMFADAKPILEARGLRQRYGDNFSLKDIDLTVAASETLALIGPSGAGKSTVLRLLDLLESPSGGTIFIKGQPVTGSASSRLELRRKMAFVHQKPLVFTTSVFDNIAQPLRWRGMKGEDIKPRVAASLAEVGLAGFEGRQAKTLSGGETQRVALARALVTSPDILFLDEPTANLDPNSTAMVEELVSSIIRKRRLTVVMATHDLAQGQRLADRIGVMMKGELLQLGTGDEIFMAPACRAVAEFIGIETILEGSVIESIGGLITVDVAGKFIQATGDFMSGDRVNLFLRPDQITVSLKSEICSSARNRLEGTIINMALVGPLVRLEIDCGIRLLAVVTRQSADELGLATGKAVVACLKAAGIHVVRA
ncbi:ABC transporter ATP-binding protein [Dehalogenimonas sp. 4OHTPN]|uniref:ABC transporter ATP-binding protein n=1 Tax=Dehalogenimonas sp. 4OHTPN TaxID=3166643 RepID=A0AAU8G8B6_9CHLR